MSNDNKIIFSNNLEYYMKKNHIDRMKLCDDLKFKYSTVSEWIAGKKYPRIDKIEKLAVYFGINKSDLIEKSNIMSLDNASSLPIVYNCKYYQSVSAGLGTSADETCRRYNYFFKNQYEADRCFAVDIRGDSMEPELHDGDIAIVDTETEPQNNDIVVLYDKTDDLGYIKQYRKTDNCVMFVSYNTSYPPMIYPLSDLDRVKIFGKVIAINRKY